MGELNNLREEIKKIDQKLFDLINQRLEVSSKIGIYKNQHSTPIRDPAYEQTMVENNGRKFGKIGIEISRLLIEFSCAEQEKIPARNKKNIIVFGGQGAMGQWIKKYFFSRGHTVSIIDEGDSFEKAALADVVVLATPISVTSAIIEKLITMKAKGLIFDLASLKNPLIDVIEKATLAGLNITSIHPMFGPDTDSLVEQTILICGKDKDVSVLFDDTCVNLISIPIKEHDRAICYISTLTHLVNYLFIAALDENAINPQLGSTSFKIQLGAAKRVLEGNQKLYYELFSKNASSKHMIQYLEQLLQIYKKINLEEFVAFSEKRKRYFL